MINRSSIQVWSLAALAAGLAAFTPASAQITETTLLSFQAPTPNGEYPLAGVIFDSAGNLYGTSSAGGASNQGIVYKVDTAGKQIVLYNFTGGADGGNPQGSLLVDSAGNLYGTAAKGGASNAGVVFKVDPAGNETVLYTFTGKNDGGNPQSSLIRDAAGNFYGTTAYGGVYNEGTLFMLTPSGKESVVYSFMGGAEGGYPSGPLLRDAAGNFYGTTLYGGTTIRDCSHPPVGCGVAYEVTPAGREIVLHTFGVGTDGAVPYGGVIRDAAGNFYGTTYYGGVGTCDCGTVFKITPSRQESILFSFTGSTSGQFPQAGLAMDSSGNLYGTTYQGGSDNGGVVFKLSTAGEETILHNFQSYPPGPDGYAPVASVTLDPAGNIYGTTKEGGPALFGALFKLSPAGAETILPVFDGNIGGNNPQGGVTFDANGILYGTTYFGGTTNTGVLFKLNSSGNGPVPFSFPGGAGGANPVGNVVLDKSGNAYGVTIYGGNGIFNFNTGGVIYKVDTAGSETVLYTFPSDFGPRGGLLRDTAGNLYGTTYSSGSYGCDEDSGCGSVYKLTAAGQFVTIHEFAGGTDGANPDGPLIADPEGNLYGTTILGGASVSGSFGNGVVFKIDTQGNESVLFAFENGQGGEPANGVVRDSAGNLYGVATIGGANNTGLVYKIDPAGTETVLYNFTMQDQGGYSTSYSGLTIDADGNLFGTTYSGGLATCGVSNDYCGTVYEISASGDFTLLYEFTGTDGANPQAPVTLDPYGNLYGTTPAGGAANAGVVFKLTGVSSGVRRK